MDNWLRFEWRHPVKKFITMKSRPPPNQDLKMRSKSYPSDKDIAAAKLELKLR